MKLHWLLLIAMMAVRPAGAAAPQDYQPVPGASPEPVLGSGGLRDAADLEAFLDGVMAAHLRAQRIAGAVVAVVKDGSLYFAKGYGYADLEKRIPVDPEKTLFRPGSTTKLFTWTAVMQLVEAGKLDLDADVNSYLTQFQIPATFSQPITLRNLLTHSGGLEDGGIGYLMAKSAESSLPLAEALRVHMPARVRPPTTDFNDATNSSYSNWGTALAGLIVANVSGMPFEDYQEKYILGPLGMAHSSFREPLPAALLPHMSAGYTYENGAHRAGVFEYIRSFGPAGNLSSTAADMAKFMLAHLQDGRLGAARILREETARLMHSRQLSPHPHVGGAALGFYETWINGRRLIGHGGDTTLFHTDLALFKDEQLGIFVSYNSNSVLDFSARDDLLKAFMDRYYPARLPRVSPPADFATRAARYAGSYRVIRHNYTKNEKVFALLNSISIAPADDGSLLMSSSGASVASRWVEVAPSVFRRADEEDMIAFTETADGAVNGFVWPFAFHAVYKLRWYETAQWHGLVAALTLLMSIAAIGGALRHWQADRSAPAGARHARRLGALLGLCHVAFVALLVATFSADLGELIYAWPPTFRIALAFPLIAVPLTVALSYFAVQAWRKKYWTGFGRLRFSLLTIAGLAFLWSLQHLNLIGYHFG